MTTTAIPASPTSRQAGQDKPPTPAKDQPKAEATTSPINLHWANEIATNFGLSGQLGKKVADQIADQIAKEIVRKYDRKKLAKIVRQSVANSIE